MNIVHTYLTGPLAAITGQAIALFARIITAPRANWLGTAPSARQRIYFANHSSHGDTILIWTVLPDRLRAKTRPVAAAEYWNGSALRRFIGHKVFRAVPVDRRPEDRTDDPLQTILAALDDDASLILFPEGTRSPADEGLQPFKSGLYNIAAARPDVELVPVWIANLNRVMPRGRLVPVPQLCTVTFGVPIQLAPGEDRTIFLARARATLLDLAPDPEPDAALQEDPA